MSRLGLWACVFVLCTGFEWPGRLEHLKYELTRGQPAERRDAVRRLGAYPTDEVREPLLSALEDEDREVRKEAAGAVARAGVVEAAPLLSAWLGDRDGELREAAVSALGALAEPSAREALTRALSDALPAVRREAAIALANVADDEALLALQTATGDADPSVREATLRALRGHADGRALPALSGRIQDESPAVRVALVLTLGSLRDARALPLLVRAAETERGEIELAAVMALGELAARTDVSTAQLLPVLRKKLSAEPRTARAAIAAIGRVEGQPALALLVETLDDPELALAAKSALVERVRRKAGTPASATEVEQLTATLNEALANRDSASARANLIADAIAELAGVFPSAPLHAQLVRVIESGRGDPLRISRALAATSSPDALVPLLERLTQLRDAPPETGAAPSAPLVQAESQRTAAPANPGAGDGSLELERLLDAMLPYFEAGLGDGRATEPLLAQLAAAKREATRVKLITLLGWSRSPRAVPALIAELSSPSRAVRLASLEAIGRSGAAEGLAATRPFLDARDADVRTAAARAFAALARDAEVAELLETLDGEVAADRGAILLSLGLALGRLRPAKQLTAATEKRALSLLARWVGVDDLELSAHVLDALRRFGHPAAARTIARELLSPKLPRRAAATFALEDFPGDETRRLLRFVLQKSAQRASVSAVLALGEVGDQRDIAALLRVARNAHWPLPAAATFALRRIAEREDVKKRALERSLCELTDLRDPYARANLVTALATLGGGACPDVDLKTWYAAGEPSVVRAAAARWLRARAEAATEFESDPSVPALLASCSGDPDPLVRASCAPGSAAPAQAIDVVAYDVESQRPLAHRLVALRFSDASAWVGYTDANARVQLARVPAGPVVLENPAE